VFAARKVGLSMRLSTKSKVNSKIKLNQIIKQQARFWFSLETLVELQEQLF